MCCSDLDNKKPRDMSKSTTSSNDAASRKGTFAALAGLFPFLRPYRRQFVLAGIALLVAAGATLAIPYAFKQMIDHGFGAAAGGKNIANVNATFLALFGVAAVLGMATAARFYMVSWLGERVTADIRSAEPSDGLFDDDDSGSDQDPNQP